MIDHEYKSDLRLSLPALDVLADGLEQYGHADLANEIRDYRQQYPTVDRWPRLRKPLASALRQIARSRKAPKRSRLIPITSLMQRPDA
jgi:hypothetical protein